MKHQLKSGDLLRLKAQCIAIGIFQDRDLSPSALALDSASGGYIAGLLKTGAFQPRLGNTLMLYRVPACPAERVLLIGLGNRADFSDIAYRRACTAAATGTERAGAENALMCLPELAPRDRDMAWATSQAVVATAEASYRFQQYKTSRASKSRLKLIELYVPDAEQRQAVATALAEGSVIAEAVALCRDLGNLPGNVCTPAYLAAQAHNLAKEFSTIKLAVLDERRMETLGMGSFLAVARGSEQDAKLVILEYRGTHASEQPLVFIGKGITFDTGGISLKPGPGMDEMKFDMCGAASVLALIRLCATLKLPLNVTGMLAAAENMPDGRACRPGDIVTTLSGQTVEILNTDAEGRLVLCDALTYAERLEPQLVIDIATLTGACIVALGHQASGLLSADDPLCEELQRASSVSGDRIWRLPLWEEYGEPLKSNFADMANVGGKAAGTITAACFLSRFTQKFRWAHLDIAGTAWHSGERKGATGRPVPLLAQFLLARAKSAATPKGRRTRRDRS